MPPHFISRWAQEARQSLEAKLGSCPRCMTSVAVLCILSWSIVVALGRMHSPSSALLIAAYVVAFPISLLALAHAAAFVARLIADMPLPHAPGAPATRRGCGCSGSGVGGTS
jgi:hypothetical protein